MTNVFKLFLFVMSITAIGFSASAKNHRCGHHTFDSLSFKYCIDDSDSSNRDLLYVLHGSNGTHEDWLKAGDNRDVQAEWDRHHIASPIKITVSYGDEWMFTDVPGSNNKPYQRVFVEKIIPWIESQIPAPHGRRMIKGVSMGGWNGVQLLLKEGALFDRIALICPVISKLGPFSDPADIEAAYSENSEFVNRDWFDDLIKEEKDLFKTRAQWHQHDPLALIRNRSVETPRVYLSCAESDEYMFFEGTELFAQELAKTGVPVQWVPTKGGHCVIDAKTVSRFFTNP